jgi:hypothetical protein
MAFKMRGYSPFDKNGNPEATADAKVGKQIAEWGYIPGSINKEKKTIMTEDGTEVDMMTAKRNGITLWQHMLDGTL